MANSQKIVPNLWCDGNAKDVAEFYTSVFDVGKINFTTYYPKSEAEGLADFQKDMAGQELTINFEIYGYQFTAINAGPEFKPNPSISFFITCDSKAAEDELWEKLSDGGKVSIPLGKQPFSEYYGWVQDKFGFSWQLILNSEKGERRPKVMPSLMFAGDKTGQAEEAMKFYVSVFKDAKISENVNHYPPEMPDREGMLAFGDFQLEGEWLVAMDSGVDQDFTFNEAVSLLVNCEDQAEIDDLWEKLSAVPESEQCGWLKDKYGVSWQIAPKNIDDLVFSPDGFAKPKAFPAMMQMKKLDIETLKQA